MAGNTGKDRCIDDPEISYAVDPEFAVNHAALVFRLHGTGAAGMVAPGVILDMAPQLIVSIEMAARDLLFGD